MRGEFVNKQQDLGTQHTSEMQKFAASFHADIALCKFINSANFQPLQRSNIRHFEVLSFSVVCTTDKDLVGYYDSPNY